MTAINLLCPHTGGCGGGGTSFFGLYGYVPLDTVWFLGPYKFVYIFTV